MNSLDDKFVSIKAARGESMLQYIYHALESFQSAFSRQHSWQLFAAVVLGFLATPEMVGVTSMCRF